MLEGDLNDFTLPDILQLLAYTTKSGRLVLRGRTTAGRIDLAEGQICDASSDASRLALARRLLGAGIVSGDTLRHTLEQASELPSDLELADALTMAGALDPDALPELIRQQVVDAVFDLLRWDEGTFSFDVHAPLIRADAIGQVTWPVKEVLAEAQQRLDDWPDIARRTGAGDAVVTIKRPADGSEVNITPDGWGLLGLIDGRRTVDDLVALSGQGEFRTRSTLASLLDAGVAAVGATDAAPVEVLLADHQTLADLEARLTGEPGEPAPAPAAPPPPAETADVAPSPAYTTEEAPEPWQAEADRGDDAAGAAAAEIEAAVAQAAPELPVDEGPALGDAGVHEPEGEVTPLRRDVRRPERLRTDPSVDADLIERLIDGVENL